MALSAAVKRENYIYRENITRQHVGLNKYLDAKYKRTERSEGYRAANLELFEISEKLKLPGIGSVSISDDSIVELAKARAANFESFINGSLRNNDIFAVAHEVEVRCEKMGIEFPVDIREDDSQDEITAKYLSAMMRVKCEKYWRRKIRVAVLRQGEKVLRESGFVRGEKSPYLSNWAFRRWEGAQRRNAALLKNLNAVNEAGESIVLAECAKASVSNPVNRRNELMTRMRGFEEEADRLGLVGLFFTLTCPSKFHAQRKECGRNPKFDGSTPLDGVEHLNKTWQLIRAKWMRDGIRTFGFRIAEPHHDGTPHFHFLLFVQPERKRHAIDIFKQYAMAVDPLEDGAAVSRWNVKEISASKGTAAGYIAKYVSKNIDGFGISGDWEGGISAENGAARVRAWSSVWGIRQFQQVGSVSVTVWREVRKKKGFFEQAEAATSEVQAISDAAESGDWACFCRLMGGVFVRRAEQTLRPVYIESVDVLTRYGDALKRMVGLMHKRYLSTREHVWRICEKVFSGVEAQPPPLDLCQ